MNLKINLSV